MLNIKVIFIDTNDISLETLLSSSYLSKKDLESLEKYKIEETKKEKACSLILKNKYIKDYHLNEFGKPISDNSFFNISHSKGMVVFTQDSLPIGIDIEKIRPATDELKDYISSIEEKEYITDEKSFFEIWTNKESLTKAIGTGIKSSIKEIPSLPINGVKQYKGKSYYSKTIQYNNYVICVTRELDKPFDLVIVDKSFEK